MFELYSDYVYLILPARIVENSDIIMLCNNYYDDDIHIISIFVYTQIIIIFICKCDLYTHFSHQFRSFDARPSL